MGMDFQARPIGARYWRREGVGDSTMTPCDACVKPIERGEPVTMLGKYNGVTEVYHARCEWGPVAADAVPS